MVLDLMADALKDMRRAHDEPTAYLARQAAREALQVYVSLAITLREREPAMKAEDRLARALEREFLRLPVTGRFEAGANQEADHVTVTDKQGGIWELALFSRAPRAGRNGLLRELAAAARRCRLHSLDRLGYREISAFEVTEWVDPAHPWQPAKLRLHATKHAR